MLSDAKYFAHVLTRFRNQGYNRNVESLLVRQGHMFNKFNLINTNNKYFISGLKTKA